MTTATQSELIDKLDAVLQLATDIRFGQLLANIGMLVEGRTDHTLWNIEDEDMLRVLEDHRAELARRLDADF
jgi:hypothetical protein